MYGRALALKAQFGSLDFFALARQPGVDAEELKEVRSWVYRQRYAFRSGRLPVEKVEQLSALGVLDDLQIGVGVGAYAATPPSASHSDSDWTARFEQLKTFRARFGHSNLHSLLVSPGDVPLDAEALGGLKVWVDLQRQLRRLGKLESPKETCLSCMGFAWSKVDARWDENFALLRSWKEEYGTLEVPSTSRHAPLLARFVRQQRLKYRQGLLTQEQIARLDSIDFPWETGTASAREPAPHDCPDAERDQPVGDACAPGSQRWKRSFKELSDFISKHGHSNVHSRMIHPSKVPARLKAWVDRQRQLHRDGLLDPEKQKCLTCVGLAWTRADARWDETYIMLREFKGRNGHTNVPNPYEPCLLLGRWVSDQRARHRAGKLTQHQISRLDEVGFLWDTEEALWERNYAQLVRFHLAHGHVDVPSTSLEHRSLASWVRSLRRLAEAGQALDAEKRAALEAVGLVLHAGEFKQRWDDMYERLVAYKNEHGHCRVPQRQGDLGRWVSRQRLLKKWERLEDDRVDLLQRIGFEWAQPGSWDRRYEQLVEFHAQHGHCRVPPFAGQDPRLMQWIRTQRSKYHAGTLARDRIAKLEQIGFEWLLPPTRRAGRASSDDEAEQLSRLDGEDRGGGSEQEPEERRIRRMPYSFEEAMLHAVRACYDGADAGLLNLNVELSLPQPSPYDRMPILSAVQLLATAWAKESHARNPERDAPSPSNIKLYFADAGTAALAQREWGDSMFKVGFFRTNGASIPVQRDDQVIVLVAPGVPEFPNVERIISEARNYDIPVVIFNHTLARGLNMGFLGKRIQTLLNQFRTPYCLRHYFSGIILFRRYPFNWQIVRVLDKAQPPNNSDDTDVDLSPLDGHRFRAGSESPSQSRRSGSSTPSTTDYVVLEDLNYRPTLAEVDAMLQARLGTDAVRAMMQREAPSYARHANFGNRSLWDKVTDFVASLLNSS